MSEDIARQFVEAYFETLQKSRADLINFYTDNSILSNEGSHYKGLKEIGERIESYSFQSVRNLWLSNIVDYPRDHLHGCSPIPYSRCHFDRLDWQNANGPRFSLQIRPDFPLVA